MSEAIHHAHRQPHLSEKARVLRRPYAADVLLIADAAISPGSGRGRSDTRAWRALRDEPVERLDMESVVRKLVALLDEQQR